MTKVVIEALERINIEFHKTIVMVTHDPQIASHCKRIIFLKDGEVLDSIKKMGSQNEFYKEILNRMEEL
ncbi:MAG: hypothetical protein RSD97_07905 [Lachnospiraceae bacterium]